MHTSEHNTQVALLRWGKILAREKARIPKTDEALRQKAALCGFLAGDGSVKLRHAPNGLHYTIRFFPDDLLMLETYKKFMNLIYDKTPHPRKSHGNCFELGLTSRTVFEDICNCASFGIRNWSPSFKLFSIPGAKEAWLRAFFSAEAYAGKSTIKLQTVNEKGMRAVSQLLNDVGIAHNCYEYVPRNKNHSKVHIILIRQKAALLRFYEKIGFWHAKKTEALKKSLDL